jgi:hypothetical protein
VTLSSVRIALRSTQDIKTDLGLLIVMTVNVVPHR